MNPVHYKNLKISKQYRLAGFIQTCMYLQLCWYCYWKEMMIIEMIWNKLWTSSCLNALLIYWTAMKSYQILKEARFGNFLISAGQYSFGLLSYCSLSVSLWETELSEDKDRWKRMESMHYILPYSCECGLSVWCWFWKVHLC